MKNKLFVVLIAIAIAAAAFYLGRFTVKDSLPPLPTELIEPGDLYTEGSAYAVIVTNVTEEPELGAMIWAIEISLPAETYRGILMTEKTFFRYVDALDKADKYDKYSFYAQQKTIQDNINGFSLLK